jgi:hypothetical protein
MRAPPLIGNDMARGLIPGLMPSLDDFDFDGATLPPCWLVLKLRSQTGVCYARTADRPGN